MVEYNRGGKFLYRGISPVALDRALYQLDSLGQFVNKHCKADGVECIALY